MTTMVRMRIVSVSEAKAHLSALLRRVERGESILIERHGRLIARIEPATRRGVDAAGLAVRETNLMSECLFIDLVFL